MDSFAVAIHRAGEFFMHCLWLQGQMVDLIILFKDPLLRTAFINSPSVVPDEMVAERAKYWEKDFGPIRTEFERLFGSRMKAEHVEDLEAVYLLRNAIAHCHVSMARDYFLFRPGRGEKQISAMASVLKLDPIENPSRPIMMKLSLSDEARFMRDFNRLKGLDEDCFSNIAASLGVPHGRIR